VVNVATRTSHDGSSLFNIAFLSTSGNARRSLPLSATRTRQWPINRVLVRWLLVVLRTDNSDVGGCSESSPRA
jgi:hypothetical protein